jgi:hypothetical protein
VKGLLTGVVMQAGMVLGLRVAQAGIVEDDPGRGLATLEHRVAALDGR